MARLRVKIKQMGETFACAGLHFGGGVINSGPDAMRGDKNCLLRRRLEPTEVLEMDEDDPLFEPMWDSGLVEITREMPTRPLDYATPREAELCAPSFISHGPADDADVIAAKHDVERRLFPELNEKEIQQGQIALDAKKRQRRRQVGLQANEALS